MLSAQPYLHRPHHQRASIGIQLNRHTPIHAMSCRSKARYCRSERVSSCLHLNINYLSSITYVCFSYVCVDSSYHQALTSARSTRVSSHPWHLLPALAVLVPNGRYRRSSNGRLHSITPITVSMPVSVCVSAQRGTATRSTSPKRCVYSTIPLMRAKLYYLLLTSKSYHMSLCTCIYRNC